MDNFDVTGQQIREARKLLGLSLNALGSRAGVNRLTLKLWEAAGPLPPNALAQNLARVLRYLHSAGIRFDEKGARLLKAAQSTPASDERMIPA